MLPNDPPTRRTLLASAGVAGALYLASSPIRAALGLDPVEFDRTTYVDGPVPLRVDWQETYNGEVVERTGDGAGDDASDSGPRVSLGDVLPGDEGAVRFRLSVDDREETDGDDTPGPARSFVRFDVAGSAENDVTEPERRAGDAGTGEGTLQDHVHVTLWKDTGIGGSGVGACNGRRDPSERVLADGTVADVASEWDEWTQIEADGPRSGCLDADGSLCFGLEWSVDADVGNAVQGDSFRFDVSFRTEPCNDAA